MAVTTITYTYRGEAANETSNTKVNLSQSITLANAVIFAQELAKLMENITDGQLVNISISSDVSLPVGLRTAPVDGSRVQAGAYFGFRTVNGYPTSMRVPTRLEAIVTDNSRTIDIDDEGPVEAFITAMLDGIDLATATPVAGTGVVAPVDTHADSLSFVTEAKEQFAGG